MQFLVHNWNYVILCRLFFLILKCGICVLAETSMQFQTEHVLSGRSFFFPQNWYISNERSFKQNLPHAQHTAMIKCEQMDSGLPLRNIVMGLGAPV